MTKWIIATLVTSALAFNVAVAAAQSGPVAAGTGKQCLDEDTKATIKKLKALNRRLTNEDPSWPFDPDYFVGKWDVEWDVPDSPFSDAGTITGTLTIQHVEGCYYTGQMAGKDASGAFTSNVQIIYDPMAKYLVWIETNSRGYMLVRPGPIGGDLGGTFTHYWQTPPVTLKGQTARLQGTTLLTSPLFFRLQAKISAGDDPYMNYGNPWFRKQGDAPNTGK